MIYGYGKWIDTEFEVQTPFHLFFGENEAGKSTLMSFIHSIFFGFPTRHSSASRYEPKQSSRYGGKIIIQDKRFGEVSIERILGKVTGDVTVQFEDGTTGDESALSVLFQGKTRDFYESIYSFDLKGIEDIRELNEEQLNRYFLSIGALGHEKYLKQADYYHTQAGKLFKPMGRKPVINHLHAELKENRKELERAKEKNDSYLTLIKDKMSIQDHLTKSDRKLADIMQKINHLKELSRHREAIEEIEQLKNELAQSAEQILPEEGLYQLKQYNSDIERFQQSINELQEKQKSLQHRYQPSKELVLYQENEEELSAFEKKVDEYEDQAQALQLKKKEFANSKQAITEIKLREKISLSETLPPMLTERAQEELEQTISQMLELDNKIKEREEIKKLLLYRIKINDDMIDNIEPKLITLSEYNRLLALENQNLNAKKPHTKSSMRLPLILSALVIGLFLFTVNPFYGVGALLLIAILSVALVKTKEHKVEELFPQEKRELLYEQKNLRKQWKELLATNDEYQSKKEEAASNLSELTQLKEELSQQFEEWKIENRYPDHLSPHSVLEIESVYSQIRNLERRAKEISDYIESLEYSLNEHLSSFEYLFARTFIAEEVLEKFREMKHIFRQIQNEQRELKEYIKRTEAVQHEINYYVQKISEIKKAKRLFFESLHTTNEDEIYQLYANKKERQNKKVRLNLLLEKIPIQENGNLHEQVLDVDQKVKKLYGEHESVISDQKSSMKKIMEIEMQIKRLEDGGTYTELLQEYENEKSNYQEVVDKWSTLKIAAGMIERTLHFAKEDKLPQALAIAESYFSFLTNEKYQQLKFTDQALFVIDQDGNQWRTDDLSRGTVEPLYIALRLAFIKAAKDTSRFPVIIDDPFVNLDATRVKKMYDLLTHFDEDIQVIYFSFDPRIRSFIGEDKCVYLTKEG